MKKRYAYVEFGGVVTGIETRCSCIYKKDAAAGELAIEEIVHPELIGRYVEIPEGVEVVENMKFSDGVFGENLDEQARIQAAIDAYTLELIESGVL